MRVLQKNKSKLPYFLLGFLFSLNVSAEFKALDPELTNYTYPFDVKFTIQKTQNQNLKMAYMDIAPIKPNGKTVVLLHGKNFSGNYWEKTIEILSKQGFRVVVPDQIGFGKSTKPDFFQYSFQQLGQLTFNLLDELKIKNFYLVGHSMGGMLATRMGLMHPERISKLILVNPIGLEDWKIVVPYQTLDETFKDELSLNEEKIRNYQKASYFAGQWKPEYEKQIEILVGWTKHPDYKKVAWNAALTRDMIMNQPVFYEFKNLKIKTLLIIGTRDKTALGKNLVDEATAKKMGDYAKLGKATEKLIPGSRLVEISGVGHMPQVEAFETYGKALSDFLK